MTVDPRGVSISGVASPCLTTIRGAAHRNSVQKTIPPGCVGRSGNGPCNPVAVVKEVTNDTVKLGTRGNANCIRGATCPAGDGAHRNSPGVLGGFQSSSLHEPALEGSEEGCGGLPAEGLAGPVVELAGDTSKVLGAVHA